MRTYIGAYTLVNMKTRTTERNTWQATRDAMIEALSKATDPQTKTVLEQALAKHDGACHTCLGTGCGDCGNTGVESQAISHGIRR